MSNTGIEPATSRSLARCFNQLSYAALGGALYLLSQKFLAPHSQFEVNVISYLCIAARKRWTPAGHRMKWNGRHCFPSWRFFPFHLHSIKEIFHSFFHSILKFSSIFHSILTLFFHLPFHLKIFFHRPFYLSSIHFKYLSLSNWLNTG